MCARRSAGVLVAVAAVLAACGGPVGSAAPTLGGSSAGASTATAAPTSGPGATPAATPGATAPATQPPADVPTSGTWARIDVAGPSPDAREDHTWTVDAAGRTAYLFGGRGGGKAFGDLWAFDLQARTWERLDPAGPKPDARFGHEAAWVDGVGLVITLGQAGSRFFDDIWAFDPATTSWQKLPDAGDVPVARYGSCSGVGPDGRLWISHGFTEDGVRFADSRAYDFAAGRWADVTPTGEAPVKRCLHACWWTGDGALLLYGGQTNGAAALGDLWRLEPASGGWTEAEDPGPAARQLAAVGRAGGVAVVFGGRDVERRPLADTWILADGTDRFVRLETPGEAPSARSGAAFVHDAGSAELLLFGGVADGPLADLWSLTLD